MVKRHSLLAWEKTQLNTCDSCTTTHKLQVAKTYATSHTEREQKRYVSHYNLRSQDKHFECGERVLILTPDSSSSRLFSKWTGPATVVEVRSPYSYTVELDGVRKHFHANKLRKFHTRVDSVECSSLLDELDRNSVNTCAMVYNSDKEFGDINVVPMNCNHLILPFYQVIK